MKTVIGFAFLLAAGGAVAEPSENVCLHLAKLASSVAQGKLAGIEESDMAAMLRSTAVQNRSARHALDVVIPFIYTVSVTPASARQLVYLKCKAGEYELKR